MIHFQATVLTMFPEMFPGTLNFSLAKKSIGDVWTLNIVNIKDYAQGLNANIIDDKPYGGGTGMVMRPDVLGQAIDHAKTISNSSKIYYMSPRGRLLNQNLVNDIVSEKNIIIICGRYEGIDQRIIEEYDIEEISIGDYILSGGEPAAIVMLDACIRLLPGVIMKTSVFDEESFCSNNLSGLLEYPLYTRPAVWRNKTVPEVLTSGNHQIINKWKIDQAKAVTKERRGDLWDNYLNKIQ